MSVRLIDRSTLDTLSGCFFFFFSSRRRHTRFDCDWSSDVCSSSCAGTDVLVLGNHGLVLAGDDCKTVEDLVSEVQRRLAIPPRLTPYPDYAVLAELADCFSWNLPDEDDIHALGTDAISRRVLCGGLLFPCQAIFSNSNTPDLFRSIPYRVV